jgi:hypothetical protein
MKISELITELEKAMAEHGDIEVDAAPPEKVRVWLGNEEQEGYIAISYRPY